MELGTPLEILGWKPPALKIMREGLNVWRGTQRWEAATSWTVKSGHLARYRIPLKLVNLAIRVHALT